MISLNQNELETLRILWERGEAKPAENGEDQQQDYQRQHFRPPLNGAWSGLHVVGAGARRTRDTDVLPAHRLPKPRER